jgi:hypothetical protein
LLAVSSHVRCNSKAKKNQPSLGPPKKTKKTKKKKPWEAFFKEISSMFAIHKLSNSPPTREQQIFACKKKKKKT